MLAIRESLHKVTAFGTGIWRYWRRGQPSPESNFIVQKLYADTDGRGATSMSSLASLPLFFEFLQKVAALQSSTGEHQSKQAVVLCGSSGCAFGFGAALVGSG